MKYWQPEGRREAFNYCREVTRVHSKSFYVSTMMLPEERRWATFAVYAFCRYADNIVDEPGGRSNEDVWRELEMLREGLSMAYKTGNSEHPVLLAFIEAAKRFGIPQHYPMELIHGVEMDLRKQRYETFADLYVFCYRVAAVVGLMMTHILGFRTHRAFVYAEKLGIAMQLTNILRDIHEDKDRGRIYLPAAELREFGVSEADIVAERMNPEMRELMRFQVARARRYYEEAQPGIRMLRPESQFGIYSASRIYGGILRQIESRDYNPYTGRVYVSGKKKLQILVSEILRTKLNGVRHRLQMAAMQ
jgi:phytoene synthase